MSSNELILSVENLSVGYDEILISSIDFEINVGEIIAIVGPSGIGKTTFLRTVAGLVRPLAGEISCNAPRRGGIGYIPQRLGLVRHTSVYHNVDLGARSGTPFWSEPLTWFQRRHTRVIDAVNRMGLAEKIDEPVRRLSGGEQRRG
ncbi:MAG: ATP-binding cassette domain-containing protein, partial [Candidatus Poseidoniaceae archaeon]|nr:ATP-binding cassette domain-containing protein [Candidatus Poseidoniaceae archaeon]